MREGSGNGPTYTFTDFPYFLAARPCPVGHIFSQRPVRKIDAVQVFEAARFKTALPGLQLFKVQQERRFRASGGGRQLGPEVHGSFIPLHPGRAAEQGPLWLGGPRPGPPSWEVRALENVSKAGGEIGGNRRWDTSLSDHSPPMGQRRWAFGLSQSCSISIFNAKRKVTLGYNV